MFSYPFYITTTWAKRLPCEYFRTVFFATGPDPGPRKWSK